MAGPLVRPLGLAAVLAASLTASACVAPPTSGQRLAESANVMSMALRFGRLDVAADHVAPAAREDFVARRGAWGDAIRIDDVECVAILARDHGEAEVVLSVAWHASDETIVRTTHLVQRWRDVDGGWRLVAERRTLGDPALLGEAPLRPAGTRPAAWHATRALAD